MKLLIAYDGSGCAEAAIDDLARCGLPAKGEGEVISVAEVWLPPPDSAKPGDEDEETGVSEYVDEITRKYREAGERILSETQMFARHARIRVQAALPGWTVGSGATYGSPAWEILNKAEKFRPDLIVVGSHGQSALSRLILGSISQKVLTEARCSVRVARGRIEVEPAPQRIVVAFDHSRGAQAAVDAVASREWAQGTQVRLINVSDPVTPSAIGRFVPPIMHIISEMNVEENTMLEKYAANAIRKLEAAGLKAALSICPGNPKTVLVDEAENWSADSIFLGANAWGSNLERFLIGSTSAAVAARAHCSVEVVRTLPADRDSEERVHRSNGVKS
jgi:nucleotide-binding universal stress UspA family protein